MYNIEIWQPEKNHKIMKRVTPEMVIVFPRNRVTLALRIFWGFPANPGLQIFLQLKLRGIVLINAKYIIHVCC